MGGRLWLSLTGMPQHVTLYAYQRLSMETDTPMETNLKRKSFFVDECVLRQAKKALGVKTDAEAIRLSVKRIAEMEEFWQFMQQSRQTLKPGSLEEP
jgi:hypothetical protein